MQGQDLFEYAVIRLVPRVEREEFLNVGLILYCARKKYLKAVFTLDEVRLTAFCKDSDLMELNRNLDAFVNICKGSAEGGPIGQLDIASRFRWLTATRSTVLQSSKVHPGFCKDPEKKLQQLYSEMVLLP
ncbi:DUF3037 domain-containing protein [Pedobacter psychroterrae]|uniref:DUF3037 domain-containing protein n=1 Tax=Pedobacter psychroterrae TaxID=2530453 RepID=A0A4R0NB09_9SPHI|nr:DUF3037 domain-containing protein [Pedobacter psychroterrae]TCC97438.1 DUF3037 domain-containing protein [Pedobacter psychroterrae]